MTDGHINFLQNGGDNGAHSVHIQPFTSTSHQRLFRNLTRILTSRRCNFDYVCVYKHEIRIYVFYEDNSKCPVINGNELNYCLRFLWAEANGTKWYSYEVLPIRCGQNLFLSAVQFIVVFQLSQNSLANAFNDQ